MQRWERSQVHERGQLYCLDCGLGPSFVQLNSRSALFLSLLVQLPVSKYCSYVWYVECFGSDNLSQHHFPSLPELVRHYLRSTTVPGPDCSVSPTVALTGLKSQFVAQVCWLQCLFLSSYYAPQSDLNCWWSSALQLSTDQPVQSLSCSADWSYISRGS